MRFSEMLDKRKGGEKDMVVYLSGFRPYLRHGRRHTAEELLRHTRDDWQHHSPRSVVDHVKASLKMAERVSPELSQRLVSLASRLSSDDVSNIE